MNDFDRLATLIRKFPGIGSRQARRIAQWIIEQDPSFGNDFSGMLQRARSGMRLCPVSFHYFQDDGSGSDLSPIVRDQIRDHATVMVVEKQADLESVEGLHLYKGQYFVLGELAGAQEDIWKASPRIRTLIDRAENDPALTELILALSATPDGDRTALLLSVMIGSVNPNLKLSTLGRGLSSGSELEYLDQDTMKAALAGRSNSTIPAEPAEKLDEQPF